MANSSFFKSDGQTTSLQTNLEDKAADAEKLAINPEDDQFTLSDGTTTGYSALHHKEKALDAQTAAETAKTAAETAKTAAETAKTGAETAKTAAETAKTGAETAQTAAETAETNAETAETNASTSATNAATSETNAATSATTASTKASEASTSASNAATSATSAETAKTAAETAKTAAETAKTAAETAKTAAETAETNAETAESNASTSETNAANSATSASTSATTATTKASEASTSATNAAASATTASTKASEASTSAAAAAASQTAAAASAASAASAYDQFDDRYLGTKSSDPTTDNDGNTLVEGALYFSSTDNAMQVYDGSAWIAASSAGNVSITETHFTATAGQTTFNVSYTVDNLVVIMNGVVLQNGAGKDYTATNGTSFTLASGAAAGDELHVIVFKSFTTADMVSKTNGGAYSGSVDFTGGLEINGTAVTATAAELNTLDGITATTSELNTLDGVTATASEINTLDGITATTTELNLLDGVTATTAELNYVDGVTSNIQTQIDNIASDLVDDTTPQLGGDLDTNGNDINFGDNDKAQFGDSNDLIIHHNGGNSFIEDNGSGSLYIDASNFHVRTSAHEKHMSAFDNGAVELYHDNSKKLETTSTGVEVTGDLRVGDTGNGSFKAVSGNYGSIEIDGGAHGGYEGYSIGGRAVFMHNNASSTGLYNDVDNEWLINCAHNGATHLYYNGSNKFQTTSSGAQVNGNLNVTGSITGAGKVLQVKQDVETAVQSVSGTGESTILSLSITPSSTSSKILILSTTNVNITHGYRYGFVKVYRGSSQIFMGNASGNRERVTQGHSGDSNYEQYVLNNQHFSYLDSPNTTSAVTYNIKMGNSYYNTTTYNNRTGNDSNQSYSHRGASSLILMEIAG